MLEMTLRQAIIYRVHDKSPEELHEVIQGAIHGEELALPGLGVLFEIIWEHSEPSLQDQLVNTLKKHLD